MKKDGTMIDFEDISNWSEKTFPDLTLEKQLLKLETELEETAQAENEDDFLKETADVYIVSVILKNRFNSWIGRVIMAIIEEETPFDELEKYVNAKMEKNKSRVWAKQKDGTYHHV